MSPNEAPRVYTRGTCLAGRQVFKCFERNPPKHYPTSLKLRGVSTESHSSTDLRPWSSAKVDKLLVDSDIYYSLIDRNDSNHRNAVLLNKKLLTKGVVFITLNLVIFETATVLSHKISQEAAVFFMQNALSGKMEIISLDELLEKEAFKIFFQQQRKNVSFVDCANMALMKKLGLTTIFSFDKIYQKNGFIRVGID